MSETLWQCTLYDDLSECPYTDAMVYRTREEAEKMNENMGMYTGEAIDADEWRDADRQTIAKYAAKLRLAGEAE